MQNSTSLPNDGILLIRQTASLSPLVQSNRSHDDQANPEIEYKITRQTNWCSRQVRVSMKHILPGYHRIKPPQTWAGRTKGPGWDFIWQMILNRSLLNNASRTMSQTSLKIEHQGASIYTHENGKSAIQAP